MEREEEVGKEEEEVEVQGKDKEEEEGEVDGRGGDKLLRASLMIFMSLLCLSMI